MITHTYEICVTEEYLSSRGLDPSGCAFFDIETTGFRAASSHLYLIGAACRISGENRKGDSCWQIVQWMAEQPQEEAALLNAFAEFMTHYETVIHFNGKRFDIPYLEDKYTQYGLPSPFRGKSSVDLYLDFRPLKAFLNLDHMNQKSLELFLGVNRDDQYDGGRLIPVYREFCRTHDENLLKLLLLHNKEDVEGMLSLPSLYGYLNFLEIQQVLPADGFSSPSSEAEMSQKQQMCLHKAPAAVAESISRSQEEPSVSAQTDLLLHAAELYRAEMILSKSENEPSGLLLSFRMALPVPVPVSKPFDGGYFTLKDRTGKLLLHVRKDTLYYYFPDYKNYYYLPEEDQAVHKSVAAYVDKQYRQPAKADTCYIRQSGAFLPQPEEIFSPALRRSLKDPYTWFVWKDDMFQDTARLADYLLAWLRQLQQ